MTKYTTQQRITAFWAKVDTSDGMFACWNWIGGRTVDGYGRVNWKGKLTLAHRLSWEFTNGQIPDGLNVLHNCPDGDNPACVNPAHLFLGTQGDNIRDMFSKGRGNRAKGEQHSNAKLTEKEIKSIRQRFAQGGVTKCQLGRDFGVSEVLIGLIVRRKSWKHIP